jgi:hypothetical protein
VLRWYRGRRRAAGCRAAACGTAAVRLAPAASARPARSAESVRPPRRSCPSRPPVPARRDSPDRTTSIPERRNRPQLFREAGLRFERSTPRAAGGGRRPPRGCCRPSCGRSRGSKVRTGVSQTTRRTAGQVEARRRWPFDRLDSSRRSSLPARHDCLARRASGPAPGGCVPAGARPSRAGPPREPVARAGEAGAVRLPRRPVDTDAAPRYSGPVDAALRHSAGRRAPRPVFSAPPVPIEARRRPGARPRPRAARRIGGQEAENLGPGGASLGRARSALAGACPDLRSGRPREIGRRVEGRPRAVERKPALASRECRQ